MMVGVTGRRQKQDGRESPSITKATWATKQNQSRVVVPDYCCSMDTVSALAKFYSIKVQPGDVAATMAVSHVAIIFKYTY
jgi:hypothetical protein